MSLFIKDYIGLNGLHSLDRTILMCETNDIYVPFKYTPYISSDVKIKTNYEFFITNYTSFNIIIDSRMIKTITYIANTIDDILIYNINNNEVISLTQFVMNKTLSSKILNIHECVNILNLFVFINFFCNNKPSWNCDIALNLLPYTKSSIPNSFSIPYIYKYILTCVSQNKNDNMKLISPKKINIQSYIQIQDGIKQFQSDHYTINDIVYSLKNLKNIDINYILL